MWRWRPSKLIYGLLSLAWALSITNFSTDRFSAARTSLFFGPLLRWLLPTADEQTIYLIHIAIRKLAHLSEYALLAMLLFGMWSAAEIHWRYRWFAYTLVLVLGQALFDEYLQSLSRQRIGSLTDTLIDLTGAALALLVIWLVRRKYFSTLSR
ncbi:MAG: VanZ family protein [Acidobacteriota bacterium]